MTVSKVSKNESADEEIPELGDCDNNTRGWKTLVISEGISHFYPTSQLESKCKNPILKMCFNLLEDESTTESWLGNTFRFTGHKLTGKLLY